MRMLFVMDPLGSINIDKDTTFAFMLEAQRRGHGVYWCTVDALGASESDVWATADRVRLERTVGAHFETLGTERHSLADFGAVWMRKDPPVTLDYFYATHILDLADPQRTLVLNRPAGLRAANEKSFILGFGDVIPATIVTKSRDDILAFLDDHDGWTGNAEGVRLSLCEVSGRVIIVRGGETTCLTRRYRSGRAGEGERRNGGAAGAVAFPGL